MRQATDALKRREYDAAIAKLSEAIRLVPGDAEAWSKYGEAYAAKGEYDRGLASCTKAISLSPSSSEAYRRRGNVYYHAKDFERALADYEMALKLDPLSAIAYFDRGGIYLQLKQIDRAIDDYDQALWLDAGFSNAFAQRGNAWLMKGNFDHAWDDYNRAIEADPRNPYGYVCRGAAAASRYAFDEAIADYNEAIRIDPTYKEAYRYREKAEKSKNAIWWGKVYLAVGWVATLAILFGAFRSWRSPSAFSHSVERHFNRMPDGRLVFYPTFRGVGYLVPDAEREQALRIFSRHLSAVGLVFGIVVMVVGAALIPVTFPLISWLVRSARLPMTAVTPLWSIAQTSGIFAALLAGLRLWRRRATRGLELVVEGRGRPQAGQWVNDFVQDMPVTVRWIVLAAIVLLFAESFRGVWDTRDKLSIANVERISFMGWLDVATSLSGLCFFGWLLFAAARRQRRLRET